MTQIAMCTALMAICSWISFPIGAVPITLQTMAVCIATAMLGFKKGILSVLLYIALGAIGVPVFSNFGSGVTKLLGPTGGYIIGFIFTAVIVGIFVEKLGRKIWVLAVSMVIGILVCYAFGTAWFIVVYTNRGTEMPLAQALSLCVTPFLIPDAVKIIIATIITNRVHPLVEKIENKQ